MKWSSHILIADNIFNEVIKQKFPSYKKNLRDGSIYPDKKDFKKAHHNGREDDIERNVEKARELRLSGNPRKALFRLGIALHYIQDKWTAFNSSSPLHDEHEQNIQNCPLEALDFDLSGFYPVMNDESLYRYKELTKIMENKLSDKNSVFKLINHEKPFESTAFLDLNMAYRISYRVAEMVMDSIESPELARKLDECHEIYCNMIAERKRRGREKLITLEKEGLKHEKSKGFIGSIRKIIISYRKKGIQEKSKKDLASIQVEYSNECTKISRHYADWYKIPKPAETLLPPPIDDVKVMSYQVLKEDNHQEISLL